MSPTLPIEELLNPVSAQQPCGEDGEVDALQLQLEAETNGPRKEKLKAEINRKKRDYDGLYRKLQNLEAQIQPRQAVEVVTAKGEHREVAPSADCDWAQVKEEAAKLLGEFKHLRVAVILCLAAFREDGLAGFRDSLALLHGLLDRYWEPLLPRLEAENKDPGYRLSALRSLSLDVPTEGPYRFVALLRDAPLCTAPKQGALGLKQINAARDPAADGAAIASLTEAQVQAAFQAARPEDLDATGQCLADIRKRLNDMKALFAAKAGEDNTPSWELLETTLEEMQQALARYRRDGTPAPGSAPVGPAQAGAPGSSLALSAGPNAPLRIASRADVELALDAICEYYRRCEPSSPVPLLLERAKRLARLGFLEIVEDLHPDSLKPLQTITGVKPDESGSK